MANPRFQPIEALSEVLRLAEGSKDLISETQHPGISTAAAHLQGKVASIA
jgi:hypothetical protein